MGKTKVPFELTPNSRIKDGQKLLVSFYHTLPIGWDQQVVSLQSKEVLELFKQELRNVVKYWKPKWIRVTKGVPKIRGFMYTTWNRSWGEHTTTYFHLLDTYNQWHESKQ